VLRRRKGWRLDYNQRRPYNSLGHLTPNEFVAQRQVIRADVLPKKQTSLNWKNAVPCSPPTQEGLR
jgi:hypothetical protein